MRQVLMDGDEPVLPEDIIRNILKRLPVKSLIQFQCVCKHWKNLIKVPSFIADHLHHSASQNPYLLYQRSCVVEALSWCFFDQKIKVVEAQSAPLIGSLSGFTILASVNGFGFSSIVNDYKIVRIHGCRSNWLIRSKECPFCTNSVNQVLLYSLSTGSWKQIEVGNLDRVHLMSNGLYVNGAIFWYGFMLGMVERDENDGCLVVSFDLATEVFTLIPLPSSAHKSHHNVLSVHENNLAMLCHTDDLKFSLIHLWVMEEGTDASRERWNWKFSTDPFPSLLDARTIWGNEIVCNFLCLGATKFGVKSREGRVVLFNITTNEFKMFDIPKYGDGTGSFFNYVESLVSVGNNHIEEL
ncbi:hypothetical protein K1719_026015 [Acacia pycnantha]|nr:hypothetical protein K1719_026015 [Acacia pycnantha]